MRFALPFCFFVLSLPAFALASREPMANCEGMKLDLVTYGSSSDRPKTVIELSVGPEILDVEMTNHDQITIYRFYLADQYRVIWFATEVNNGKREKVYRYRGKRCQSFME